MENLNSQSDFGETNHSTNDSDSDSDFKISIVPPTLTETMVMLGSHSFAHPTLLLFWHPTIYTYILFRAPYGRGIYSYYHTHSFAHP
jgi:hypothetical protein